MEFRRVLFRSAFVILDVHHRSGKPLYADENYRKQLGDFRIILRTGGTAEERDSVPRPRSHRSLADDEKMLEPGICFLVNAANDVGNYALDRISAIGVGRANAKRQAAKIRSRWPWKLLDIQRAC